jgi:hypothetical protein
MRLVDQLKLTPVRFQHCRNAVGVLQSLGAEVDQLRSKKHQQHLGLVVVIDADDKGFRGRVEELERRVASDARDGARRNEECVAYVVPAWEIETWYVHLCCPEARPIDETRDYKPTPEWRELAKDLGAAAKRAVEAWAPEADRVDPPSLSAARQELARVQ